LKLETALQEFGVTVRQRIALDIGAGAGGFTIALLDAGAQRVYAVDAGHGQLLGSLRQDARVVNLEATNLGTLNRNLVPEVVEVISMDLSYLALTNAVPQLEQVSIDKNADLVALVKPMFELGLDRPPSDESLLIEAVQAAALGIERAGWRGAGKMNSPILGTHGAIEFFLHARRA
jgi:23S rRNA (cytidine1920-2'-O)/16S rRNA (cytidine1409-2'-O)-methyltransferase